MTEAICLSEQWAVFREQLAVGSSQPLRSFPETLIFEQMLIDLEGLFTWLIDLKRIGVKSLLEFSWANFYALMLFCKKYIFQTPRFFTSMLPRNSHPNSSLTNS